MDKRFRRAILATEWDDGWWVLAGYIESMSHTEQMSGPSTTSFSWALGSPKAFRTHADVDWSTVPEPMDGRILFRLEHTPIEPKPCS